mgnify:CR=1 FL=1
MSRLSTSPPGKILPNNLRVEIKYNCDLGVSAEDFDESWQSGTVNCHKPARTNTGDPSRVLYHSQILLNTYSI